MFTCSQSAFLASFSSPTKRSTCGPIKDSQSLCSNIIVYTRSIRLGVLPCSQSSPRLVCSPPAHKQQQHHQYRAAHVLAYIHSLSLLFEESICRFTEKPFFHQGFKRSGVLFFILDVAFVLLAFLPFDAQYPLLSPNPIEFAALSVSRPPSPRLPHRLAHRRQRCPPPRRGTRRLCMEAPRLDSSRCPRERILQSRCPLHLGPCQTATRSSSHLPTLRANAHLASAEMVSSELHKRRATSHSLPRLCQTEH